LIQGRRFSLPHAAVAIVAAAGAATLLGAGTVKADAPPSIVVQNGETQAAFGYTDAIRQRVWVDSDFDSDKDGVDDKIAVDIIRPAASDQGMKVPVVMDDSPYYSTLGRGNESQLKIDDANGDGLLAQWPAFLDNYFVPRGYAVALVDMTGTNHSTGCPTVQDETDNKAGLEALQWLAGMRTAHDKDGALVSAGSWYSGKTGMIGKSYDGALAAATAVQGAPGLATAVTESGPYDYYDYTRSNGVIQRANHYVSSLANTVTDANRRAYCKPVRDAIDANDADATGNFTTPFWSVRDYIPFVPQVKASILATHGLQDENVRPDHFSKWWYALQQNHVPSKAYLMQVGHVDPFDVNRQQWVDELHHWYDYWLQGVQNGIMDTPQVTIETGPGQWEQDASWPVPGSTPTQVFLQPGDNAGKLGLAPASGAEQTTTFQDSASQRETAMLASPTTVTANKRVFLSPVLSHDLRISGTPEVQLDASIDKTETHFGAILVDYGPAFPRVVDNINNNGVQTLTTSDCWGLSSATDSACFKDVGELTDTTSTAWRVSKGVLDADHRTDNTTQTPIAPNTRLPFSWPLLPADYTFKAGHQIGVVIVGSYRDYSTSTDPNQANITFSLKDSRIVLPIVGGGKQAVSSGLVAGGAATSTTVTQDAGETVSPAAATFSATVASADAATTAKALPGYQSDALPKAYFDGFTTLGTPTGSVQFTDGGQPLGAPVPLTDGVAKLTISSLGGGSHQIGAHYVGEGGYDDSDAAAVTHLVGVPSQPSGTVPATLSLTLGAKPSFGDFTPGVAKTYTASTTATVISTAGDALLTVSDPDTVHPGHLVNGTFALAQGLQAKATDPSNSGSPFNQINGSYNLLAWSAPVSNDPVTISFQQQIGANEALRTGSYDKTLTYTLSTTTP